MHGGLLFFPCGEMGAKKPRTDRNINICFHMEGTCTKPGLIWLGLVQKAYTSHLHWV